jgi:hypothetical protein
MHLEPLWNNGRKGLILRERQNWNQDIIRFVDPYAG